MRLHSSKERARMMSDRSHRRKDASRVDIFELVLNQLAFGLTYAGEARAASGSGNLEYAELARQIAVNSYTSAVHFIADASKDPPASIMAQLTDLERLLESLAEPPDDLRSIA